MEPNEYHEKEMYHLHVLTQLQAELRQAKGFIAIVCDNDGRAFVFRSTSLMNNLEVTGILNVAENFVTSQQIADLPIFGRHIEEEDEEDDGEEKFH